MTYQYERDEFISLATREGLSLDTCRRLLRYATTLHRLAEAQCNGDWPYNGDRDRPNAIESHCHYCDGHGKLEMCGDECPQCKGVGKTWHRDLTTDALHDKRYTVCPKCDASGVAKTAMTASSEVFATPGSVYVDHGEQYHARNSKHRQVVKVCPDCRTQELVRALLKTASIQGTFNPDRYKPIFQGDPRGAVLRLATPNYPWSDDGSKGSGLYVPARVR